MTIANLADPRETIRASWSHFESLYDELLEIALAEQDVDDASLPTLLEHMIGNIQLAGLRLRADPARPALINSQYAPWSWGHANPDTLYLSAHIDDAHDYRVFGEFGTVSETTLGVYTGMSDQSDAVKVRAEDLHLESDGSFEAFFTRERRNAKNWFKIPNGAKSFGSYQTYGDWDRETKGTIRIECLAPPAPAIPQTLDGAIRRFEAHLEEARDLFTMWVRDIPERVFNALSVNTSTAPMQPPAAMAGAWFSPIPWELKSGEGLVIEYAIPENCSYSGLCLTDRWGRMIDIDTRQTSLNLGQSLTSGGRVRVLLSAEDVGVHNWLDARGQHKGLVTWRVSSPTAPGSAEVAKISLADVDGLFADTERVTQERRAQAVAKRLRHFAERNTP
jgi:hypothetical protein